MSMELCQCQGWAHTGQNPYKLKTRDGIPLIPNHHPNCHKYNDSLIDVFRHSEDGSGGCYFENLEEALDSARQEFEYTEAGKAVITKEKMHREVFENLPEFEGF